MSTDRVAEWYNANVDLEHTRLDAGRLEYAVTLHHINSIIAEIQIKTSRRRLRIADIGCGTGRYAIALAQQGHETSISDISSNEVQLAQKNAAETGIQFQASKAFDAGELNQHAEIYVERHYDIVLLLGPFYHILDQCGREQLLETALKTLQPGGHLLAAFVSRNAHLRDIAVKDPHRLHSEADFYQQYLKDGKYTRGSAAPMHHTTVQEIHHLLNNVGKDERDDTPPFELVKIVACEGFLGFQLARNLSTLGDSEFQSWLNVIVASASDKETFGAADHLLVILKRTG